MHQNQANMIEICGLKPEYVDLTTGKLTTAVDQELNGNFYPQFSNKALRYNDSNRMVSVDTNKTNAKAFIANVDIYFDIPMFSLSSTQTADGESLFPRNYIGQTHLPILHRLMILVRPIRQALDISSQMVRLR